MDVFICYNKCTGKWEIYFVHVLMDILVYYSKRKVGRYTCTCISSILLLVVPLASTYRCTSRYSCSAAAVIVIVIASGAHVRPRGRVGRSQRRRGQAVAGWPLGGRPAGARQTLPPVGRSGATPPPAVPAHHSLPRRRLATSGAQVDAGRSARLHLCTGQSVLSECYQSGGVEDVQFQVSARLTPKL